MRKNVILVSVKSDLLVLGEYSGMLINTDDANI